MKITFKTGKDGAPHAVEYSVPDKLEDLVKQFGADVVAARAKASIIISAQSFGRSMLDQEVPKSQKEIEKAFQTWKPGVKAPRGDVVASFSKKIGALTAEQRAELAKLLAGGPKKAA